jgi:hypothetical protein
VEVPYPIDIHAKEIAMRQAWLLIASIILGLSCVPADAGSTALNCPGASSDLCTAWCDHAGGGMQSNPDGSVTCTVLEAAMEKALTTPMKQETLAKIRASFGSGSCVCERSASNK